MGAAADDAEEMELRALEEVFGHSQGHCSGMMGGCPTCCAEHDRANEKARRFVERYERKRKKP